ncbi:MAG: DUF2723 domain-containing protein [Cytophagaceae bacterium]|nr:DUF2723 domain-containing protein [Cytophagaceae bacterium]
MNYQRINNITGWLVFAIATIVYVLTLEPTSSFWDCGEFISTSYKLMVPHPPGAPIFLLIGRLFSFFAMGDLTQVAFWINMTAAISSSLTILFLFWSITLFAKKLVSRDNPVLSTGNIIAIIGSGLVGSLAYAFSDTFWFSSEEAEVYAMSSFLTAFIFWAILKWEAHADEEGSDRWFLIIAYGMGLSIGVHLLNLTAIPALAFVYYFKKHKDPTPGGIIATLLLSLLGVGVIMIGIIPGLPTLAAKFEIFFVNVLHLGFGTGAIVFVILLIGALIYGILYSIKHKKRLLNLSLLSLTFILLGFASYGVILIRSQFNPTIDMNDPENVMSFISYLKREQYGDRPLVWGPVYTAGYPIDVKKTAAVYAPGKDEKGNDKYVITDYKSEYIYKKEHMMLFPRMYSTQAHHIRAYRDWSGLKEGQKPTFFQNMSFMFTYQMGHMYWRYFLWNFAGREGDEQNSNWLMPGEWFDKSIPAEIQDNKARNNYFMLPLIAGFLGLVYHFSKNKKDGSIIAMLWFFTGLAIILYANPQPVEPRERDYVFAGSFYGFAFWIGLSVLFLDDLLRKVLKSETLRPAIITLALLFIPALMISENWDDHDRSKRYFQVDGAKNILNSCAPNAILFTGGDNDTYPLWYAQEVEGFRTDVRVCNLSLLNTDWYINQMKRKSYLSDPLPIDIKSENYTSGVNDMIYFDKQSRYDGGVSLPVYLKLVNKRDERVSRMNEGDLITTYPSQTFTLPIDTASVASLVNAKYRPFVLDKLTWKINKNNLDKKSLIMLDMIAVNAANGWKRPIYFSTTLSGDEFLDLRPYMQLEGLAYRLLPVSLPGATNGWLDTDIMYDNMINKFQYKGLNDSTIFYNEDYYRFTSNHRSEMYSLASQLLREGQKEKAKKVVDFCFEKMPSSTIPYDYNSAMFISLLLELGEDKKAIALAEDMATKSDELLGYFQQHHIRYSTREYSALRILDILYRSMRSAGQNDLATKYEKMLEKRYTNSQYSNE